MLSLCLVEREPYAEAGHADVDARLVLLRAFRGDLVQKVEVRPRVLEDKVNITPTL